jgi:hypothetical protein
VSPPSWCGQTAGYTLGRTWIEMLRIDPANHIFGLRINVFTSVIVFLGAVLFLILRRHVGREDPALVWGPDRPGKDRPGKGGRGGGPAQTDEPAPPVEENPPADRGGTDQPVESAQPEGPGLR